MNVNGPKFLELNVSDDGFNPVDDAGHGLDTAWRQLLRCQPLMQPLAYGDLGRIDVCAGVYLVHQTREFSFSVFAGALYRDVADLACASVTLDIEFKAP